MNKPIEVMVIENGEQTRSIQVTQAEWESINYVDYIELDSKGELHPDFASHGEIVCNRMRALIAWTDKVDALDKLRSALSYIISTEGYDHTIDETKSILWRAYYDLYDYASGARTVRSYHRNGGSR